jgi:hypothetical protein
VEKEHEFAVVRARDADVEDEVADLELRYPRAFSRAVRCRRTHVRAVPRGRVDLVPRYAGIDGNGLRGIRAAGEDDDEPNPPSK